MLRDELSGGLRPSDQLQQSYATLRYQLTVFQLPGSLFLGYLLKVVIEKAKGPENLPQAAKNRGKIASFHKERIMSQREERFCSNSACVSRLSLLH
jgi:hypothetical protein